MAENLWGKYNIWCRLNQKDHTEEGFEEWYKNVHMTEQNTLTTEHEVERIVEEFLSKCFFDVKHIADEDEAVDWLRTTLTPLIEDRNARAREVVGDILSKQDWLGIGNGEQEQAVTVTDIKTIALSHDIDLSKVDSKN
jgi:hypothetical protein